MAVLAPGVLLRASGLPAEGEICLRGRASPGDLSLTELSAHAAAATMGIQHLRPAVLPLES